MSGGGQRPIATPSTIAGPRRRLDRYELIAEIASGGMATVMLARLAGAGGFSRLFAIKLLHPHLASDRSSSTCCSTKRGWRRRSITPTPCPSSTSARARSGCTS
jgi:hypothetical protein